MSDKQNILIADAHPLVCASLAAICENIGMDVVGTCSTIDELVDELNNQTVDYLIVDPLNLKGDVFSLLYQINTDFPNTKIIFLLNDADESIYVTLRDIEFKGIMVKTQTKEEITDALKSILSGNTYIEQQIMVHLLDSKYDSIAAKIQSLTRKEKEVLKLVRESYANPEIANMLKVSIRTVNCHKNNIMVKTGSKNTVELLKFTNSYRRQIFNSSISFN